MGDADDGGGGGDRPDGLLLDLQPAHDVQVPGGGRRVLPLHREERHHFTVTSHQLTRSFSIFIRYQVK